MEKDDQLSFWETVVGACFNDSRDLSAASGFPDAAKQMRAFVYLSIRLHFGKGIKGLKLADFQQFATQGFSD